MERIEKWRPALIRHSAQTVQKRRQLLRMLSELQAQGVTATPFKGLVLAEQLYGDPAVRPTTDFDLFVSQEQSRATVDYFIENGYASPYFGLDIPDFVFRKGFSIELFHTSRRDYVDIHWELTDGYATLPFSAAELEARTINMPFENGVIHRFDNFVTAVLIAVHGAKNSWDQLIGILDLAMFVRKYTDFDYHQLHAALNSRGIARMLHVGIALVERLGFVEPPPALVGIDPQARGIAAAIEKRMKNNEPSPRRWSKVRLNLHLREGLAAKFAYLAFKIKPKKVDVAGASKSGAALARFRRVFIIAQKQRTDIF